MSVNRWRYAFEQTRSQLSTQVRVQSTALHSSVSVATIASSHPPSTHATSSHLSVSHDTLHNHRLPSILYDPTEVRIEMHSMPGSSQAANGQGKSSNNKGSKFSNVVRTAMLVRNWAETAAAREEEEASQADVHSSVVFAEPTRRIPRRGEPRHDNDSITGEIELTAFALLQEIAKQLVRTVFSFAIRPSSPLAFYWTTVVIIAIAYNTLALSIFIFEDVYLNAFIPWLSLNLLCDFIYLLDAFLQSRTVYMKDGAEVRSVRQLFRHYRESNRMIFDILSLLPMDLFLILSPHVSIVRINRLIKAYRIEDFIEMSEQKMESKKQSLSKIFWLVSSCYAVFHWNACVYFLFSIDQGIDKGEPTDFIFNYAKVFDVYVSECPILNAEGSVACLFNETNRNVSLRLDYVEDMMNYWDSRLQHIPFSNFSKEYSMSLYWSSLTITTCGQQPWPANSAQNMLEVVDTLIGLFVFATILGSVGNVVSKYNSDRTDFQEQLDGTKFFMKARNVDRSLQQRVIETIRYIYDNHLQVNEHHLLSCLPPRLQGKIAVHLHMTTLVKAQLFYSCDYGFMYELVMKLKQQQYAKNDIICQIGERAQAMYIVKKGTLVIKDPNKPTQDVYLTEGSTFGELSVVYVPGMSEEKRSVSLQAVGYADVYILTRDDVSSVLQEYPEERKRLVKQARHLHAQQMGVDEEESDSDWTITTYEIFSFDEKVSKMNDDLRKIEDEMNRIYEHFTMTSSEFKRRLTSLEEIFKRNSRRVRREYSLS